MSTPSHVELRQRLDRFLSAWIGRWPPPSPFSVVGWPARVEPTWDGQPAPVIGVMADEGTVLSVPDDAVSAVEQLFAAGPAAVDLGIGAAVGFPEAHLVRGVFRWSEEVVELDDAGEWVDTTDPRLPDWLRPFNGGVLVAFDERGKYAAGVGCKRHNALGVELAVGTEPEQRGKGFGRRLVAQAARRLIEAGEIVIYLHNPANHQSAAVADAAGFPDRGWKVIELAFSEGTIADL